MDNIIYILIDPNTGEIRYVGLSTRGTKRIKEYFFPSVRKQRKRLYVYCWLNSLFSQGKKPIVRILQQWEHIEFSDLCTAEVYWIAYFREIGAPLTNLAGGGGGCVGLSCSEETKKKLSKINRGRKHTPEAVDKIRNASTGRRYPNRKKPIYKDPGYLDKLSNKMKGNKFALGYEQTEETKTKKSLALKGNKNALGYKHTEEWKREASKRFKGNKHRLGKVPWNKGKHIEVCKNNHKQTDENVYTYPNGKKKCRVCERDRMRKKRAVTKTESVFGS